MTKILLIDVLSEVAKENDFALHGGTAMNLFVRNMSVELHVLNDPLEAI